MVRYSTQRAAAPHLGATITWATASAQPASVRMTAQIFDKTRIALPGYN